MTRTWITGMICSKPEGFFETPFAGGSPGGTRLPRGLLSVTALGIVGGGAPSGGLGETPRIADPSAAGRVFRNKHRVCG